MKYPLAAAFASTWILASCTTVLPENQSAYYWCDLKPKDWAMQLVRPASPYATLHDTFGKKDAASVIWFKSKASDDSVIACQPVMMRTEKGSRPCGAALTIMKREDTTNSWYIEDLQVVQCVPDVP